MPSEIYDCCLQQDLMPTITKRRQLLHTRCLPTQTQVRDKLGTELADVIFDRMNPVEKCLMGVDKPLKGPTEQMWVDPRDKAKGNVKLTPIPCYDHIRALTHQGVLEIGGLLEQRLETHEKYKIDTAVREAVEFEQFEAKLRMKFLLKKERQEHEKSLKILELKLLEQQRDREDCLKKVFEDERNCLVKFLQGANDVKLRETVASAVHKTRERLSKVYERRYCEALLERIEILKEELKEEYEVKGLVSVSDAKNDLKREVRWELQQETDRKMQSLEVKHLAEIMHIVCAERTTANDKLEQHKVFQRTKTDDSLIKIGSLLDKLYYFCSEKSAEFCLVFEELQEDLNFLLSSLNTGFVQNEREDLSNVQKVQRSVSCDNQSSQTIEIQSSTCFPSSINWITQSSSESECCIENYSNILICNLTPQTLIKVIIKHIRRNPKYLQEACKNGVGWEKHAIKVALEQIMSFFLNGQNLTECVNAAIDSLSSDEESVYSKEFEEVSVRYADGKLIATKDSFDLISLPRFPAMPPVNTSKLIEVRDSLDILSYRSKTISDPGTMVTSSPSSSEVGEKQVGVLVTTSSKIFQKKKINQQRDTTAYLDCKPKVPKYFSLNSHRGRQKPRLPYKECTDDDIDQLFAEYEATHPNPLQKHLPKSKEHTLKRPKFKESPLPSSHFHKR